MQRHNKSYHPMKHVYLQAHLVRQFDRLYYLFLYFQLKQSNDVCDLNVNLLLYDTNLYHHRNRLNYQNRLFAMRSAVVMDYECQLIQFCHHISMTNLEYVNHWMVDHILVACMVRDTFHMSQALMVLFQRRFHLNEVTMNPYRLFDDVVVEVMLEVLVE